MTDLQKPKIDDLKRRARAYFIDLGFAAADAESIAADVVQQALDIAAFVGRSPDLNLAGATSITKAQIRRPYEYIGER